jgi:hypothetical protein
MGSKRKEREGKEMMLIKPWTQKGVYEQLKLVDDPVSC